MTSRCGSTAGRHTVHYTDGSVVGEALSANLPEHAGTVHIDDEPIGRLSAGQLDICPSIARLDALVES